MCRFICKFTLRAYVGGFAARVRVCVCSFARARVCVRAYVGWFEARVHVCVCVCVGSHVRALACVCVRARVGVIQREREQRNTDKRSSVVYRQAIAVV